jgi:hypothetical protein
VAEGYKETHTSLSDGVTRAFSREKQHESWTGSIRGREEMRPKENAWSFREKA